MRSTAVPTDGQFPVRRKRPNQPSVDNARRASWRPPNGGWSNVPSALPPLTSGQVQRVVLNAQMSGCRS